jgi:tRNA pseudouridine38-40 synthase
MRNIRITLEYDGGPFSGWQVQPGKRTIQGEIMRAVSKLAGEAVKVIGAGRTDAGVHAVGQVANFNIATGHSVETIRDALNGNLPQEIYVKKAEEVPAGFHARFDAYSKTYQYIFILKRTALWRDRFLSIRADIDIKRMRAAASRLQGERDFSCFASSSDGETGRCRIISTSIIEQPPLLVFEVTADRFLYNMVRAMAGSLLEVGRGKDLDIDSIIESKERSSAGPTLPPYSLYLMGVRYAPPAVLDH